MSFPLTDNDLVVWLNKFARVFNLHALALGFTPEDVTSVSNDAAMFAYLAGVDLPAYERALSTRIAYKNLIKDGPIGEPDDVGSSYAAIPVPPAEVDPGIVPRLRELIQRIQALPDFSSKLAKEFGFEEVGLESISEPPIAKPTGRAYGQLDSEVRVEFAKSAFDGVLIESRRTGQGEWSRLAIDNFSPYVDSRPLVRGGKPEVREYRMRFLMRDEPVGEWSDILVATASG